MQRATSELLSHLRHPDTVIESTLYMYAITPPKGDKAGGTVQHLRAFFYQVMLVTVVVALVATGFTQRWALDKKQRAQVLVTHFSRSIMDTELQLSNRLASLYFQSSLTEAVASQEKHAVEKLLADAATPGELDKIGIFSTDCLPFLQTNLSCLPTAPETFRWDWEENGKAILVLQRKIQSLSNGWLVGQVELGPRWKRVHAIKDEPLQNLHFHIGRGETGDEILFSVGDTGLGLWATPTRWDKFAHLWLTSQIETPATWALLILFLMLLVKMGIRFRHEQNQRRQLRGHFFQWCSYLEQNPNTPWKLPQEMRNWTFREKQQTEQAVRSIGVAMQVNHENIGKLIERCATLHKELTQTKSLLDRRNSQQKQHAKHGALAHQVQTCTLSLMKNIDTYEEANRTIEDRMKKVLLEESESFVKIISYWNHSIHKHGGRKFFRVLEESPSEEDPKQTQLESQLNQLRRSSSQVMQVMTQFLLHKKKIPNFGKTTRTTLAYWYSLSLTGSLPQEYESDATHMQALPLALSLLEQRGDANLIQIVDHSKGGVLAPQIPHTVWVAALFYALEALLLLAKPNEKTSVLLNTKEGEEKHHLLFSIMDYQLTSAQERQEKIEPSLLKVNTLIAPFGVACHLMQTLSGMCSLSFIWAREVKMVQPAIPLEEIPAAELIAETGADEVSPTEAEATV